MPNRTMRHIAAIFVGAIALLAAAPDKPVRAETETSVVLVMYHRFGESDYPSTNIRLTQFEAHLAEIKAGGYTVLPVTEIVAALKAGRALPDKTLGITIDDAFASVYREAWPRLKAANIPFTLFAATDPIDTGTNGYMTWDQMREMAADANVTFGHHSASHAHMVEQDRARNSAELDRAEARFQEHLGLQPVLFAYPFGEFSSEIRDMVTARGFSAAFGQQSGALHSGLDFLDLPRFPLNEHFGDIDRFRLITTTRPLPVHDVTPRDPMIVANPPALGFTLDDSLGAAEALSCYAATDPKPDMDRLGGRRVEIRFKQKLPSGRVRVNCTLPADGGRWRWYGMQFYVPRAR